MGTVTGDGGGDAVEATSIGAFLFIYLFFTFIPNALEQCKKMYVYSGHALSYTKLVHRHATQTEGNKYFK